jgi:hypothetical protein
MQFLEESQGRAIVLLIRDQQHERSDFGAPVPLVPLSMRGNVDDGIAAIKLIANEPTEAALCC